MKKITLSNSSGHEIRIVLEPIADVFDIPPKNSADLIFNQSLNPDSLQIDIYDENAIGIWIDEEVEVSIAGKTILFPKL